MDDSLAEKIEVEGGYIIELRYDQDAQDPRKDMDFVGTMVCEHRRYTLGDKDARRDAQQAVYASRDYRPSWDEGDNAKYDFDNPGDLWAAVQRCSDIISMPLYLYDHSGITMSTSKFSCPWDSGQIGFQFCTKAKALEEWGGGLFRDHRSTVHGKLLTKAIRQKAIACMEAEVKVYDQFLTGDIYGYVVKRVDGEELSSGEIDSCWGFYGIEAAKEAAMEVVNGDKEADASSSAATAQVEAAH